MNLRLKATGHDPALVLSALNLSGRISAGEKEEQPHCLRMETWERAKCVVESGSHPNELLNEGKE